MAKPKAAELKTLHQRASDGGVNLKSLSNKWVKAKGCKECDNIGYKGMICLNEILEMTEEFRTALTNNSPSDDSKKLALKQGMTTIKAEAIVRASEGKTSIEEALAVI